MTDLPEALPLLEENILLNRFGYDSIKMTDADLQKSSSQYAKCTAIKLAWGAPLSDDLQCILSQNSDSRVIIVGADVVYRKSLFHLLLKTLKSLLHF